MATLHKLKVIEQCRISPPRGSIAGGSLPTIFFDLIFYRFHPVQRLFFYEFPHPMSQFLTFELPNLKDSLALTLQLFYPLVGHLTHPPHGVKPEIVYSEDDSIMLVVAVSNDNFYELSANHAREVTRFHHLVPPLHSSGAKEAVLSVQVTVFPSAGVGIGTTLHHAAGDGSTYTHFMKTWALINRLGETAIDSRVPLPFYDRSKIRDPQGLERIFLSHLEELKDDDSFETWDLNGHCDVTRATFVLSREQLAKLGSRTSSKCSPYAVACGYVWSCLVRARGETINKEEYFGFVTGCRARLDPSIPPTYFGNCLGICCVKAKRSDLVGSRGPVVSCEAIWKVIKGLEEGAFRGAEHWIKDVLSYASKRALTVAGSPKLGVYEVDFGWGRPRKVEIISIERTGALSLAEGRDEQGAIEVGLALPSHEMEEFVSLFLDGLSELP